MKFLLIDPFIDKNVVKSIFAMESQLPSLGLLYIGSVLEKEGHDVDLIDFCAEKFTEEKLKKKLKDTDVVGITVRTHGLKSVMKLCRIIKKLKPEITIIIGGPHCTLEPIKALKDTKADILVEGDGEFVIKEITKALQNKKPLDKIPGVHFWENNKIKNGPPAKIIMDLDKIPFPARHLVKKYKYGYFEGGFSLNKGLVTSLTISRGCPYHCRFCVDNAITKKYRARSPENIIEEIRQIEKDYDFIYIMDDNFFVDVKKTERFLDLLIKEKFDLKFSAAGIRIDMANKRLFKKMKKAGFKMINFGIESGNQDVLDFYDKRIKTTEVKRAVKLAKRTGFITFGAFIFGAPFETEEHIKNTIKFAKSLPLDLSVFAPLAYLKGSPLWDEAVKQGKIKEYEYLVMSDKKRGLGKFSQEELWRFSMEAFQSYHTRPRYFLQQFISALKRRNFKYAIEGLKLLFRKDNILTYDLKDVKDLNIKPHKVEATDEIFTN